MCVCVGVCIGGNCCWAFNSAGCSPQGVALNSLSQTSRDSSCCFLHAFYTRHTQAHMRTHTHANYICFMFFSLSLCVSAHRVMDAVRCLLSSLSLSLQVCWTSTGQHSLHHIVHPPLHHHHHRRRHPPQTDPRLPAHSKTMVTRVRTVQVQARLRTRTRVHRASISC